ncbi:head-tail connector protein [Streptococcus ferus]|uniref:head-tail connector protein n=1 Tax=Streptococcus ferus TaxID=1345 RepID=UPI003514186B
MSVTKEDIKKALNLDGKDDDALITAYVTAATSFIKGAIGEDKSGNFYAQEEIAALVDVATIALAGAYYTYRIALSDTTNYPIDLTLNSIIGQLRGQYALYLEGVDNG